MKAIASGQRLRDIQRMERIDAARLEAFAENCRCQVEECLEIAAGLEGALRREWVLIATKWIELAQQVQTMRRAD